MENSKPDMNPPLLWYGDHIVSPSSKRLYMMRDDVPHTGGLTLYVLVDLKARRRYAHYTLQKDGSRPKPQLVTVTDPEIPELSQLSRDARNQKNASILPAYEELKDELEAIGWLQPEQAQQREQRRELQQERNRQRVLVPQLQPAYQQMPSYSHGLPSQSANPQGPSANQQLPSIDQLRLDRLPSPQLQPVYQQMPSYSYGLPSQSANPQGPSAYQQMPSLSSLELLRLGSVPSQPPQRDPNDRLLWEISRSRSPSPSRGYGGPGR